MLRLTFSNTDRMNAITVDDLTDLAVQLERVQSDVQVRVVLLSGEGKAFCSGADLKQIDVDAVERGEASYASTLHALNRAVLAIHRLDKPVVAAVNGAAVGGGASLALACDVIVARRSAYFLLAFAGIGLMPDGGTTATVPAVVGRVRAMQLALLAEQISAETAAEWGLINAAVTDECFDKTVSNLVARLASGPPLAYAAAKRAINESTLGELGAALDRELAWQSDLLVSADFCEGVRAFRERRPPVWG